MAATIRAVVRRTKPMRVAKALRGDGAIDSLATGVGAALALILPAPIGQVVGPASTALLADILKGLSKRESDRVGSVLGLAEASIRMKMKEGASPRTDEDPERMIEVLEGVLFAARDSYEERKLPLIANLLATAPFTGTPLVNMVNTLNIAERLTYRQLCVLALIPPFTPWPGAPLSQATMAMLYPAAHGKEAVQGVLADLEEVIRQGLAGPTRNGAFVSEERATVRPAALLLTYSGLLLFNGMGLHGIPAADLEPILAVLRPQPLGHEGQLL